MTEETASAPPAAEPAREDALAPVAEPAREDAPAAEPASADTPAAAEPEPAAAPRRARRWATGVTVAALLALAGVVIVLRRAPAPAEPPVPGAPPAAPPSAAPPPPAGAPPAAAPPAAPPSAAPRDTASIVSAADEYARRGRYLDALSGYERAIVLDPARARDPELRGKIVRALEARDPAAGVVALELLASRVEPPARVEIAALAATSPVREVRWRAFAIAERDGFAGQIDRAESWIKDLRQATACDERRILIARLRALGDHRAITALRNARDRFPCIERDAADAIAELQASGAAPPAP